MTHTTLDLQKMGLAPLTEFEMQEIDGGNFWKSLLDGAIGVVVGVIIGGPVGAIIGASMGVMVSL